jgi:hypothetical protein
MVERSGPPCGGIADWRHPAEPRVGEVVVAVGAPGSENSACVREGLVEQFVARAAAFDLVVVCPSRDGIAGRLNAVVADNGLGLAALRCR